MAVLWSKSSANTLYEVRAAGRSRRLYRNGILHSAYNPVRRITGSIWDLLFLPALLYPPQTIQRVLMLGVGGGATIHLLNHYLRPNELIGVEIDKVHISVAKRFFDLKYSNFKLLQADAVDWLYRYQGPAFDLIIEDLFIDVDSEPVRLMHQDNAWLDCLQQHVAPTGMLILNHASKAEAQFSKKHIHTFQKVFRFMGPGLENRVLAFLRKPSSVATLNANIAAIDSLAKYKTKGSLRYSCYRQF